MRTLEMTATVMDDGTVTIHMPSDIAPGEHRIVMLIDEQPTARPQRSPLQFSAYPVGLASDSFTFRREDLYDDSGR